MRYYSTKDKDYQVSLKKAVLSGMPCDKGLFMPVELPHLSHDFVDHCRQWSFPELALEIAKQLLKDDIPVDVLSVIVEKAFNFKVPLVKITDHIYTLELFHGPTLAFKDFGARFMARLMAYFVRDAQQKLNILVATSGDTGSAVANGFYRIPGINVIVLYPADKISPIQEKQIATLGENITALEVAGNFDDCQRLIKTALTDSEIRQELLVSSANSINIARLLPQIFYYFSTYGQLAARSELPIIISVPSGNLGNLTAGLMAKNMGLPVSKFIAATNVNDVVPRYLRSGEFRTHASIQTISSAMDVGDPSNFVRILELYGHEHRNLIADLWGRSFDDEQTRQEIERVFQAHGYVCDPHGAVGSLGLRSYLDEHASRPVEGVFIETAHPAKFKPIVESVIRKRVEMPARLAAHMDRQKLALKTNPDYAEFKEFLLSEPDFR